MTIKQLSAFVENKPGRLAEITEVLHESNVDIRAMSIADTTDFGILRLIVNCPDKAEKALRDAGFTVSQTSVIAICVNDEPGGLHHALKVLSQVGVDVEYMYAFISREDRSGAFVILRVGDEETALEALRKNNIKLLAAESIYDM